jgi:Putative Ig domain
MTAFDPDSSINGKLDIGRESPTIRASDAGETAQAVADLLQRKSLTHTFGAQGEWEVRTTLVTNRHAWRYQSGVFLHGKRAKRDFPPIEVDRTRQMRQAEAVTEELLTAFAREAVEVHCTRCASVAEYITMASFFAEPPPRYYRAKKVVLVLLSIAALSTAYWWWRAPSTGGLNQPDGKPPSYSIRWQPLQVSYHSAAGEPFVFPLPTLERNPEGRPVELTLEASGDQPSWLQLDREQLHIHGTAPLTAVNQTYRFIIRAHATQEDDSRLVVVLTITGQPDRGTPLPQLPRHWAW